MCLLEEDAHANLTGKTGEGDTMLIGGYVVQCGQDQNILEEGESRALIAKGAIVCAFVC